MNSHLFEKGSATSANQDHHLRRHLETMGQVIFSGLGNNGAGDFFGSFCHLPVVKCLFLSSGINKILIGAKKNGSFYSI